MAFIHELTDRWASALAYSPLDSGDLFQAEIKRAARQLAGLGKGQFLFEQQLSDLSTFWRDNELEESVWITAPAPPVRGRPPQPPLVHGKLYNVEKKRKPDHIPARTLAPPHDTTTCVSDLCVWVRSWI